MPGQGLGLSLSGRSPSSRRRAWGGGLPPQLGYAALDRRSSRSSPWLYPPSRRRHYATAGVRATSYILLRKGGLRQSRAAGDGPPGEFQTGDFREFQTGVDSSGRVSIVLPGTPAGELLVEQYAEQRFTAEKQRIVRGLTKPRRKKTWLNHLLLHAVHVALGIISLAPIFLMISTSLKPAGEEFTFPPELIPKEPVWHNFVAAVTAAPFALYLFNTLVIFVGAIVGALLTANMAAYAFARLCFPGRDFLFVVVIATIMLPTAVTLIPQFIEFRTVNWINTPLPLIAPTWFGGGAFSIFLLRQFFLSIPRELDEAAIIDGANHWWILWRIMVPLSKPAIATIIIFSFVLHWNEFMGPLIYLQDANKQTLSLGLYTFVGQYSTSWNLLMAASVLMLIPVLIVFLIAQRYFVEGLHFTGLGGR